MSPHESIDPAAYLPDRLADQFGLMTEENGLSRSAGRIFGLLMVSGEALSFSEVSTRLQISRGGLSSNTRLLEEMGLIERISKAGSRQDYFQVPSEVWSRQVTRQMERDQKALDHIQEALQHKSALPTAAKHRLATLEWILARSVQSCKETLAELRRDKPSK